MRVKMSKQPPAAPTASAIGHCPTVIQIVGHTGTIVFVVALLFCVHGKHLRLCQDGHLT